MQTPNKKTELGKPQFSPDMSNFGSLWPESFPEALFPSNKFSLA